MKIAEKMEQIVNGWYKVQDASEKVRLEWEDGVLTTMYPSRYENIGKPLDKLIHVLLLSDNKFSLNPVKKIQFDLFSKQTFNTYMEFFTRELSEKTYKKIKIATKNQTMVLQNESYIESFGTIDKMSTILSLKKSPEDVVDAFKKFDINLDGYKFLNTKLLLTYYHRIHSPIKGQIQKMIPITKENELFGDNSLWILDIYSEQYGHLYLLLVGESQIQDFNFKKKIGDSVDIFDEIGNFNWGSQSVILYDGSKITQEINLKLGYRYFVGDRILA